MNWKSISSTLSEESQIMIKKHCGASLFQTETEIIYEGQVPTAGHYILDGSVRLYRKKKLVQVLVEGHIFGVSELIQNQPFPYTVRIAPRSILCILDRSTLKELLSGPHDGELLSLFQITV